MNSLMCQITQDQMDKNKFFYAICVMICLTGCLKIYQAKYAEQKLHKQDTVAEIKHSTNINKELNKYKNQLPGRGGVIT